MAQVANLDASEVISLANKHPRVSILNPGCGVGGHCIAVDPWFLVESFPSQTKLLQAARSVNDSKPGEVLAIIKQRVKNILNQTGLDKISLCVLGVTYKADVDDLRNSPAFLITKELQKWPKVVLEVVDPYVDTEKLQQHFGAASHNAAKSIEGSDLTIALVAHSPFKKIFPSGIIVAFDPIETSFSIVIGSQRYSVLRGILSFVSDALGPKKTLSPITVPVGMYAPV